MPSSMYWLDVNADWTDVLNWSGGAAPATGDTAYIMSGSKAIITNLNQSAVTLANLFIGIGFTGSIGSASAYLQISATNWSYGQPVTGATAGTGSGRIKINFGSAQFAGLVYATSNSSTDSNLEPLRILGTHASSTLTVLSGRVGVATTLPTEASTILTANVTGGTLNYGFGITWTTVNVSGSGNFTTLACGSGTALTIGPSAQATTYGTTLLATANVNGIANLNHRPGSGGTTTLNLYGTGQANFSANPAATTVGTLNHYPGGVIVSSPASPNHVTVTTRNLIGSGTLTLS